MGVECFSPPEVLESVSDLVVRTHEVVACSMVTAIPREVSSGAVSLATCAISVIIEHFPEHVLVFRSSGPKSATGEERFHFADSLEVEHLSLWDRVGIG